MKAETRKALEDKKNEIYSMLAGNCTGSEMKSFWQSFNDLRDSAYIECDNITEVKRLCGWNTMLHEFMSWSAITDQTWSEFCAKEYI